MHIPIEATKSWAGHMPSRLSLPSSPRPVVTVYPRQVAEKRYPLSYLTKTSIGDVSLIKICYVGKKSLLEYDFSGDDGCVN